MSYYTLKTNKTAQKIRTSYSQNDGLLSDKILSLAYDKNGILFVGTDNGLNFFKDNSFYKVEGVAGSINSLFVLDENTLLAGADNALFVCENYVTVSKQELSSAVVSIDADAVGNVGIATKDTFYYFKNGKCEFYQNFDFDSTSCMTSFGDRNVFAACDKALLVLHGKRPRWSILMPHMTNAPANIRTLASDDLGYVWLGCDDGIYIFDGCKEWIPPSQLNFFPQCAVNKIVFGNDGTIYFATQIGVYSVNGAATHFYGKGRFLNCEKALDVAVKDDNSEFWVATQNGLSRIELKFMSLSEKEAYFESKMKYFSRENYSTESFIKEEFAPIEESIPSVTDNDGLWTALYLGALCFKYAKTKDESVRQKAALSMKALLKLQTMTGIKGFPARAYRRPGENGFGDKNHEWHIIQDEKGPLEWKGETSSDELVGHYFASSLYYDFVANDEEKAEIAASIKDITDHIIENDYTLCDVDGLATTWAHFGPSDLNDTEMWCWEKGINSLELISFLRVAQHVTQDGAYGEKADELLKKYHYGMNILNYKKYDAYSNHIDDLLAACSVIPLLNYETNNSLRKYILLALRRHFEYEKIEKHPLYTFIYALYTDAHSNLNEAVETLEEYPVDLLSYYIDNSKRPDIEISYEPVEFGDMPQAKNPIPVAERVIGHLSYDSFLLKGGNNKKYASPAEWLLSYWMGKYYNMIEE